MKTIVLTLALVSTLIVNGFAQTTTTCFDEYFALFRQRGAKPVTDGEHAVILALKKDNIGRCFMGKVTVKDGHVIPPVLVEKADGTYEEFQRDLAPAFGGMSTDVKRKIQNGMSMTFITAENEQIRAFFIKLLADKAKANKAAPDPSTY